MERLDEITDRLSRCIEPASHLVSVAETRELREAYNAVLPEMSAFWSGLPLNAALWKRVKTFAGTSGASELTGTPKRHLMKTVREFRRAGADLGAEDKERLRELMVELAKLQQKFSENVLDATAAYELNITDEGRPGGGSGRGGEAGTGEGRRKGTQRVPSDARLPFGRTDLQVLPGPGASPRDPQRVRQAMPRRRVRQSTAPGTPSFGCAMRSLTSLATRAFPTTYSRTAWPGRVSAPSSSNVSSWSVRGRIGSAMSISCASSPPSWVSTKWSPGTPASS